MKMMRKLLLRLSAYPRQRTRDAGGRRFAFNPLIKNRIFIKIGEFILSVKNYINKYSKSAKYSLYLADELAWFLSFQLGEM
ncbi:hypothetical protein [Pectobacterium wasabiae]|nr:hypothetical protein [Pectobacterium wasabiae]AOR64557.1 hypothetical protein A7983_15125 [Pectobacterium wasabiae CFBP 3304]